MRPKFDYTKLRERIREKCGTPEAFALAVGLSPAGIRAKLNNSLDFKLPEMDMACGFLGIRNEEIESIFFTAK
jgi:hypothetical protein